MNALVYDLEIIKAIPPKMNGSNQLELGIEYCKGWGDHKNMGISVLCAYDYKEDRYRVFTEDNKEEFIELTHERSPLVGFNNISFDNKVIEACWGMLIPPDQCFDILREVWAAAKVSGVNGHKGHGLDACCAANFGIHKTHNGALAPIDWQRGNIGIVIDYCLHDVRMTKLLLDKIIAEGQITSPTDPEVMLDIKWEE